MFGGPIRAPRLQSADVTAPLPDLVLYARAGCHLCEETRALARGASSRTARHAASPRPRLVERDIDADPALQRPVRVRDPGRRRSATARLQLATSPPGSGACSPTRSTASGRPHDAATTRSSLAVAAGLISFLSPCVLPLVPAYLGQLTAVAVAAQGPGAQPSRWARRPARGRLRRGLRHRCSRCSGSRPRSPAACLADYLPALRVDRRHASSSCMGLSLAGHPARSRSSSARGGPSTPAPPRASRR